MGHYELAKKVPLRRTGSRTRAFQRATDEVRTLPLSLPKGGPKKRTFPFLNKTQLQLSEVCYKVSLTENFQQQSCRSLRLEVEQASRGLSAIAEQLVLYDSIKFDQNHRNATTAPMFVVARIDALSDSV